MDSQLHRRALIALCLLATGACTKASEADKDKLIEDDKRDGGSHPSNPTHDRQDERDDSHPGDPSERRPGLPPALHVLYWRGDLPERRALIHAARQSADDGWQAKVMAMSSDNERFTGNASLTLDTNARPHVTVLRQSTGGLRPFRPELVLTDGDSTWPLLATSGRGDESPTGRLHAGGAPLAVIVLTAMDGTSRVLFKRLSLRPTLESNEPDVIDATADAYVSDADGINETVVYTKADQIFARTYQAGAWTQGIGHTVPGCEELHHVAAVEMGGRLSIVHTCTARRGDGRRECRLGLTSGTDDDRRDRDLDTIDQSGPCIPFGPARPSLAVDRTGRLHVAYRTRREGGWQIQYLQTTADGLDDAVPLGPSGPLVGSARAAIDDDDNIHVVWFDGTALQWATKDRRGWHTQPIVPADGVDGVLSALADFRVFGGAR